MTIHPDGPTVVTAWTAVSPFGDGHEAFAAGVADGRSAVRPVDPAAWGVDGARAGLVPDLDLRRDLGAKGTRAMNRVTGLAVLASGRLLGRLPEPPAPDTTGVVLGTTTGSAESMMDFTRASMVGERPDHVEPAAVPGCVMNCAAGQIAIWHQLRGPNATVAAGHRTGLIGLNYARRLLVTGRADAVLCGAAEEYSAARATLERHARGAAADDAPLGEGAVMVLLEPAGRAHERGATPLATLLAVESACGPPDADGRAGAVATALRRVGVRPADVGVAATIGPGRAGTDRTFGPRAHRPSAGELIGDTASVAALFELAALLATDRDADELAVLTAHDDDGSTTTAVLRLHATVTSPRPTTAVRTRAAALAGGVR